MSPELFEQLPEQELADLKLCGISSFAQLEKSTFEQIWSDLEQARSFFPERQFCLTRERLHALFSDSCPCVEQQAETPAPEHTVLKTEEAHSALNIQRTPPEVRFQKRSNRSRQGVRPNSRKDMPIEMHSSVRCTHPVKAIMAAICTLTLTIPLASIVVLPWLMITDNMPPVSLEILAGSVLGFPCLVYIIFSRLATCPVCHMRIFRFAHYTRNRAAHRLPLLGYNFTTALHMLFLRRYNCPACGTPVKFYGVKGHRTLR